MLSLTQVRKSYDGGRTFAVDGVDFEAEAGELVALIGESGCGKTTTLKMINRLVERSGGSIRVDGQDVDEGSPVSLRRRIGYVIQGVGLFPHMNVAENVAVLPSLLGWERERIAARVDALLDLVQLPPATFRARMPQELSGGQMQRVGVARALAVEPRVVLLDEPFGALDPITRGELQQELRRIQRRVGFAAVLVTHDMAEALRLGDRIVVLRAGRVVQDASPRELLERPADPYVTHLLESALRQAREIGSLTSREPRAPT